MEIENKIFTFIKEPKDKNYKSTLLGIQQQITEKGLEVNEKTIYSCVVEYLSKTGKEQMMLSNEQNMLNSLTTILPSIQPAIIMNDMPRLKNLITNLYTIALANEKLFSATMMMFSELFVKIPKSCFVEFKAMFDEIFKMIATFETKDVENTFNDCLVKMFENNAFKSTFGKALMTQLITLLSSKKTNVIVKVMKLLNKLLPVLTKKMIDIILKKLTELTKSAVETPLLVALYNSFSALFTTSLSEEIVESVAHMLLSYQPTTYDNEASKVYCSTITALIVAMGKINVGKAVDVYQKSIPIVCKYYLAANEKASQFTEIIATFLSKSLQEPFASSNTPIITNMVEYVVKKLLHGNTCTTLDESLKITKKVLIQSKPEQIVYFKPLLTWLNRLYGNVQMRDHVEQCFISAFEHLTVRKVLDVLPLNLNVPIVQKAQDDSLLNHSYLIFILSKCHLHEELSFYNNLLMTCIPMLNTMINNSIQSNSPNETKNLKTIKYQLMQLFKTFIVNPTDYEFFPNMADIIVEYLNTDESTTLGCDIINQAIKCHPQRVEVIQAMSQKLILALFNVLAKKSSIKDQKPILKCIENVLQQTSQEMAINLFKNVIYQLIQHQKIIETPEGQFRSIALLNLSQLFIKALNEESIETYLQTIVPLLGCGNHTVVKATLKTLIEVVTVFGNYMYHKHLNDVQTWFVKNTYNDRVYERCILEGYLVYLTILKSVESDKLNEEIVNYLGIVLKLTKEKNRKTREKAYSMIEKLCILCDKNYIQFLDLVTAYIGDDIHMTSCAFNVLAKFVYIAYEDFTTDMKVSLFDLCTTKFNKSKEQNKSIMSLIKVLFQMDIEMFKERLGDILNAFGSLNEDNKRTFRTQIKQFVERMIRKFGDEYVDQFINGATKDIIQNAKKYRKEKKRKQKKAGEKKGKKDMSEDDEEDIIEGFESDDEEDDEKDERKERKRIVEADDVDLLQVKFMKETAPKKMRKIGEMNFPIDADGKLVVNEEEKKKKNEAEEEDYDNIENEIQEKQENGMNKEHKVVQQKTPKTRTFERKLLKKKLEQKERKKRIDAEIGTQFKAKKAQGDVMKNGVQPYAYIPLKRSSRKAKLETQTAFKELMKKQKGQFSTKKPIRVAMKKSSKK